MSAYIVNTSTMSIVGYVASAAEVSAVENQIVIEKPEDMDGLSLQQLTDLYNTLSKMAKGDEHKDVPKFKVAKSQAIEKINGLFEKIDVSQLVQLDKKEEEVVENKAAEVTQQEVADAAAEPGKKVRKVRDSKLQRMKAAFLMKEENGEFKQWTVKELMEKCGTSERITHVYISILRSPSDRFVMNIEKLPATEGAAPSFMLKPKEHRKPSYQSEETPPPAEQA